MMWALLESESELSRTNVKVPAALCCLLSAVCCLSDLFGTYSRVETKGNLPIRSPWPVSG